MLDGGLPSLGWFSGFFHKYMAIDGKLIRVSCRKILKKKDKRGQVGRLPGCSLLTSLYLHAFIVETNLLLMFQKSGRHHLRLVNVGS